MWEPAGLLIHFTVIFIQIHAVDDAGKPTAEHTYWEGFQPRTAVGLRFESKAKGE